MHPTLTQTLAAAHIDDLHCAAGRWRTIRLAHRAAQKPRVAATLTALHRYASPSAAWTSSSSSAPMTPTETERLSSIS
jgi:hypothetical protein